MAQNILTYLKMQLDFRLTEWQKLDDDTKAWYRKAAEEEMGILGIEVQKAA